MFLDDKIKVDAQIYSILLSADSSIEKINLGNGYEIKKIKLLDFPYKNQISNGNNKLNVDYYLSKIVEIEKGIEVEYFYCIYKKYNFFIPSLEIKPNVVYTVTYTTVLEMIFLGKNQKRKKECLAERVSCFLEDDDANINTLYNLMKTYYGYRSKSSHEGNESDINLERLFELEKITRSCVKSLIFRCDSIIVNNSNILWENIKKSLISELKKKVVTKEYCFKSVK